MTNIFNGKDININLKISDEAFPKLSQTFKYEITQKKHYDQIPYEREKLYLTFYYIFGNNMHIQKI